MKKENLINIAKTIGLLSLITGLVIFILWLCTFDKMYVNAGAILILIATPLNIIALILTGFYCYSFIYIPQSDRRKSVVSTLLIILLNIPVCLLIIYCYDEIGKRAFLTIVNQSDYQIQNISIEGESYQGKRIKEEFKQMQPHSKQLVILNKWETHQFKLALQFNDTLLRDSIRYYRYFRLMPFRDTIIIEKDYTLKGVRLERDIFKSLK
jgi:hypothetical protein